MKAIGEYKEIYNDDALPSIYDYVSSIEADHKSNIIKHLKSGKIVACAAGKATDVFTGNVIPNELLYMNDGKYEWRSDLIYYVEKYNLKLDNGFIKYVMTLKK